MNRELDCVISLSRSTTTPIISTKIRHRDKINKYIILITIVATTTTTMPIMDPTFISNDEGDAAADDDEVVFFFYLRVLLQFCGIQFVIFSCYFDYFSPSQ